MSVSVGVVISRVCEGMKFSDVRRLRDSFAPHRVTPAPPHLPLPLTTYKAVAQTYATRLFEEDPFLDLEGAEAAQKLMILARELGVAMEVGG